VPKIPFLCVLGAYERIMIASLIIVKLKGYGNV